MTFTVVWSPQSQDDLAQLPRQVAERIVRKVASAAADPLRDFLRMSGAKVWRLRVGDYRVLADLDLARRRLVVVHVGHRRNVYDR